MSMRSQRHAAASCAQHLGNDHSHDDDDDSEGEGEGAEDKDEDERWRVKKMNDEVMADDG